MDRVHIEEIYIGKVRHLSDIDIAVSKSGIGFKHIIFTGKNGSGKTSVLDAIAKHLDQTTRGNTPELNRKRIQEAERNLSWQKQRGGPPEDIRTSEKNLAYWQSKLETAEQGVLLSFNINENDIQSKFESGECIFAYFQAHRAFDAVVPTQIEKVTFKDRYAITESPRNLFIKYLLDLKMTQALAATNGRSEKAAEIQSWFDGLRDILREIYEDESLTIEFDEDTYQFLICEKGRDSFDFNSASDGFSAILDIVVGLMLRMARIEGRGQRFDTPGIALIDEIENHLHLSLQRRVLPYLSSLFPNIQFIVSTHSPFVLSSVDNAVVYDLETGAFMEDGLSANTYGSIVEGYFDVDRLSEELREKYDRYLELAGKQILNDNELVEVSELETYLDEIPDYLAWDVSTEYKKAKLQIRSKAQLQ